MISSNFIKLEDLYIAYKKAKYEAFYENSHYNALQFVEYEKNIDINLELLYQELTKLDGNWFENIDFIGTHSYLPKSYDESCWLSAEDGHFSLLDPTKEWARKFDITNKKIDLDYRLIIKPTVDYHVVSALWIMKAGYIYDKVLDRSVCYANQVRTIKDIKNSTVKFNTDALGLFSPYFSQYRAWRENGLRSIEKELGKNENIIALTMDIEKFFHRVSPDFLVRKSFLAKANINLTYEQLTFTKYFVKSLNTWYRSTPDFKHRPEGGLPVGLSASKIVSNVLLSEFDFQASKGICPLYYGRYVDDIFLVIRNKENLKTHKDIMEYISKALGKIAVVKKIKGAKPSLRIKLPYAGDCELIFTGAKQKIFSLSAPFGFDLIHNIKEQIRLQSSEYRMLPIVPNSAEQMASKTLLTTPNATLQADALRKADSVSLRRLGLSLLLRDIELYAEDLHYNKWNHLRAEFYGLVDRYLISPVGFFEYHTYLVRVFGLMAACMDHGACLHFLHKLSDVIQLLKYVSVSAQAGNTTKLGQCVRNTYSGLRQVFIQALSQRNVTIGEKQLNIINIIEENLELKDKLENVSQLKNMVKNVLYADFGRRPYKDYWYYNQRIDLAGPNIPQATKIRRILKLATIRRFRKEATQLHRPRWTALVFPTRPLRIAEMAVIAPRLLEDESFFERAVMALRGANVPKPSQVIKTYDPVQKINKVIVKNNINAGANIAITSYETTYVQWERAAHGKPDRSLTRYRNLNNLINSILASNSKPNYVTLPELSIPLRWAMRLARKLADNSISLIAGVEYHKDKISRLLRNDALISLTTNWPGYKTNLVFLQPKFAPAHSELKDLVKITKNINGNFHIPKQNDGDVTIYKHGNFFFSVLICSDLTNLDHRFKLRGRIDTLFALEWNPDIKTFSALVESAANDLHCYVCQVNNRAFGDSRIRAPFKKDYERDVVQVKGGLTDYYILGCVDYTTLRFEQCLKTDSFIFKPLPIGYSISSERKI